MKKINNNNINIENIKNENKIESIIQQEDLRTQKSVSLKGFADLNDEEKARVVEKIYLELKGSEGGEESILSLALDKLEFMGSLLLPPYPLGEHEEEMKESRTRLNRIRAIASWSDYTEVKWMIIEYHDELSEIEQEKGIEARNDTLLHWLANKLATLIKNEIIERLENLEV